MNIRTIDHLIFKSLGCRTIFICRWNSDCASCILLRAWIKRYWKHDPLLLFVIVVMKIIQATTSMPRIEEFFILKIHPFEPLWDTHTLRSLPLMIAHSTATFRLLWRILSLKSVLKSRHFNWIKLTRSVYDLVLCCCRWNYFGIHFI